MNKSIYGFVQAERKFYVLLKTYLKKKLVFNFQSDTLLLTNDKKNILLRIYIDDIIVVSMENVIKDFIKSIKQKFTIKYTE